jgi:dihydrofolate reductase
MDFYKTMSSYVSPIHYSLILARDERGGIGLTNGLPWKGIVDNKDDMAWFRQHTKGKIVIMGYNTWVSIGRKPLPGRCNIVITEKHDAEVSVDVERVMSEFYSSQKPAAEAPVIKICKSPTLVKNYLSTSLGTFHNGGEVMVIGGAKIYEAFMEWTSRVYLTTFEGQFAADTFVDLNLDKWRLVYRDALSTMKPVFEVWDTTTEAVAMLDSEIIKISYGLKPAEGFVADYVLPGVSDAV